MRLSNVLSEILLTGWSGIEGNKKKVICFRMLLMNMALPISAIVLFWQKYGMSMFEVLLLQAIFAVALATLEVPSGYFADRMGRKKAVFIGALFDFIGVVVYSISSSFNGFLAAELLLAAGISLISGADEALLYDSLLELKKEENFSKVWGRVRFFEMIASGAGCLIGGGLALISLRTPFYAACFFSALLVVSAAALHEPERNLKKKKHSTCREIFSIAKGCLFEDKRLRWIISLSAVFFAVLQIVFWLYQPYLKLSGMKQEYFGFLYAGMNLFSAIAAFNAHWLLSRLGRVRTLAVLIAGTLISLVCLGNIVFAGSFMFIFLHQITRGAGGVVISESINDLADSEIRATVLSVNSLSMRIFYSLGLIPMGWLVEESGILAGINVLALALAALAGVLFLLRPMGIFPEDNSGSDQGEQEDVADLIKVEFAS